MYDQMYLKVFTVLFLVLAAICSMLKSKFIKKNGNSERWTLIESKADNISIWYFNLLAFLIFFLYFLVVMLEVELSLTVGKLLHYGIYAIFLKAPVDYFAIRYFDKVL